VVGFAIRIRAVNLPCLGDHRTGKSLSVESIKTGALLGQVPITSKVKVAAMAYSWTDKLLKSNHRQSG